MAQWIVITDLDGTLLDAQTYSPQVARPTIRRLQQTSVPIVFCSAKTAVEQAPIRADLHVVDPYIVENGSAIIFEGDRRVVLGVPAAEVHAHLRDIKRETGLELQTFQDVSARQVAAITGLDLPAAQRAQQRDYSATVFTQFAPDDLASFQKAIAARGLKAPSGGRFLTVTGKQADKGAAVAKLKAHYSEKYGEIITCGLGDSPNDAPMLAAVDHAFQVQRPDGKWNALRGVPHLRRVDAVGPAGWVQVVDALILAIHDDDAAHFSKL